MKTIQRRSVLQFGSVASGLVIAGCGEDETLDPTGSATSGSGGGSGGTGHVGGGGGAGGSPSCVLTTEQLEGPFFIETGLERSDITEGKAGVPMSVRLTVLDAASCMPLPGAIVELWHADASGAYSGFTVDDGNTADHAGETFLRGYQGTDSQGQVDFTTIYPGWYPGRTPHFHIAILVAETRLATTQLYFDDALSASVYQNAPYVAGGPDTSNADDFVLRQAGSGGLDRLALQLNPNGAGYDASFVLAVDV